MYFNIYSNVTTRELRDQLGEWPYGNQQDAITELIAVCMILCDRVAELDNRLNQTANIASCLANGIIPD